MSKKKYKIIDRTDFNVKETSDGYFVEKTTYLLEDDNDIYIHRRGYDTWDRDQVQRIKDKYDEFGEPGDIVKVDPVFVEPIKKDKDAKLPL